MMKNLNIYILLFLCPLLVSAYAAEESRDSLLFEWQSRDSLHVHLRLTAGDVSLKTDYRVLVTPYVTSAVDTFVYPLDTVEFAGRRNRKYNDRMAVLENQPRRFPVLTPLDTLWLDTLLRVEPWMRDTTLRLCIARTLDGCCSFDTLDTECLAQTRYVQPAAKAVLTPVLSPVLPDNAAEQLVLEGESLLSPISDYTPFDLNLPYPSGAAHVRFNQDEWNVDAGFSGNVLALQRIGKILERVQADSASRIVRIVITGTASPDGPLPKNRRLAGLRADALKTYIETRFDTAGVVIETVNAGEGWGNLTALLRAATVDELPEREGLLRIIEKYSDPDRREHFLRTYKQGRPFARLLDMFDVQRTASVVRLYYEAESDTAAFIMNDAIRFIQYGSYQTAVDLLEPLDDNRRYNILGTAYYMVGRREEAMKCFEQAAILGDEDAYENLKQLTQSNKQLKVRSEE